jgi:hypothetical protein
MMKELAVQLKTATGKEYKWENRKIKYVASLSRLLKLLTNNSCLAHVINLATQLLISSYSKTPHFDPTQPDAHVPASHNDDVHVFTPRDEVGLIRAIVVKVRSRLRS